MTEMVTIDRVEYERLQRVAARMDKVGAILRACDPAFFRRATAGASYFAETLDRAEGATITGQTGAQHRHVATTLADLAAAIEDGRIALVARD